MSLRTMSDARTLGLFISYAHEDEDHHRRLAEHLKKLQSDGLIDSWDDRAILPGQSWDTTIQLQLAKAQIILLLISRPFLESEYVRKVEIPQALQREKDGLATIVPVLLEDCEWQKFPLAGFQALPPAANPVTSWPDRDSAYALIAKGIDALVREHRLGIVQKIQHEREARSRRIFRHTPLRIIGEDYDPFRAFGRVFWRAAHHQYPQSMALPLEVSSDQVELIGQDYHAIFSSLRDSAQPPGLDCDLIAIPYFLLGHCVERGLVQPLDPQLASLESNFAWWHEMGVYRGTLYGVPLSSLTMLLAVRRDLFERYGLPMPRTWSDYLAVIDQVIEQKLPIAPDLLQGRSHITLWYDWLNHLYGNDTNDLVLYGGSRLAPREAAETLRKGTESFLTLAAKLAPYANGSGVLPHWATANWDDGIEEFARGNLLMHMMFNDALDTLRRRMEQGDHAEAFRVEYLPVPLSIGSNRHNGHVEGWILCIPSSAKYDQAANDILHWFLQRPVQKAYALWGGASADFAVIQEEASNTNDGGAWLSFKQSVEDSQKGQTVIDLVKHNGPRTLEAIDRIRANLYDAIVSVARGKQSPGAAAETLIRRVEQRLLSRST